jgi:UDP-N-acetylglucosamine 2-epimerase (non-hydrolysing)
MKTILVVIGTRPEAIKMAPLLTALSKKKNLSLKVCLTRQHTDLLDPILDHLQVQADYIFEDHSVNGCLYKSSAFILEQFGEAFKILKPDLMVVQGDTTSAFAGALAAFYQQIPVAHIEAGLRTRDLSSPWPEEAHRCMIDKLATYLFTPTVEARHTLIAEGKSPDRIWVVGNTSVDALRIALNSNVCNTGTPQQTIVVTIHRRENYEAIENIFNALKYIGSENPDIHILYILHPNPAINKQVRDRMEKYTNIQLLDPLDHTSFVHLLSNCLFIITDSGGIQEEAPFLGKPILIARNTTERPEGIVAGTAKLVGTNASDIVKACKMLLTDKKLRGSMSRVHFPYGDGYAAEKIANILEQELNGANLH